MEWIDTLTLNNFEDQDFPSTDWWSRIRSGWQEGSRIINKDTRQVYVLTYTDEWQWVKADRLTPRERHILEALDSER